MSALKSFQAKILMITLALFIVFCTASTYSWYQNFTEEATNTAVDNISSLMEALNNNFEMSLKDIDYTSALISNKVSTVQNNCVIKYLQADEQDSAYLVECLQDTQDYLTSTCNFKTYLHGMAIYNFDGRMVSYGLTTPFQEIEGQDWFAVIRDEEQKIAFVAPHYYTIRQQSPSSSRVFSIVRPVLYGGEVIGLVMADIKCALLDEMFDINNINGYTIYVTDSETGALIYAPEDAPDVSIQTLTGGVTGDQGHYFTEEDGTDYLVVYTTSSFTPWTVVGIVERSSIISGFISVRKQMILMISVYGLVFAFLSLFMTQLVTRDLRRLSSAVASIDGENIQLPIQIKSKDEVGVLYKRIQAMLTRIRTLIADIRRTEAEKRESEIQMLSMQINPHFLYNTLNTIKILSSMQGIQNIQTVSDALSNMLHLNLDPRRFISIREESGYLKDYLSIQEYRYAGKFTYDISVEHEAADCMLPKLLIQPIVKNALHHGISASKTVGFIQIRIGLEGELLRVAIKNTGKPFDQALLEQQHYCGRESSHIGLRNIDRRLKLLFGERGELKIFSDSELFTVVEILLPAVRKGEESAYDTDHDC